MVDTLRQHKLCRQKSAHFDRRSQQVLAVL
jgi:hypothetical protein